MFKVSGGIGITLGPVIGGQLYQKLGYMAPFFFAAFMFYFAGALCLSLIPIQADTAKTQKKEEKKQKPVGFCTLVSRPMVLLPVLMNVMI